jgi:hypothetical protein
MGSNKCEDGLKKLLNLFNDFENLTAPTDSTLSLEGQSFIMDLTIWGGVKKIEGTDSFLVSSNLLLLWLEFLCTS